MNLILDSHTFFWWTTDHPKLSRAARKAIEERGNEIFVSAVVAWEMATKVRLGKWPEARAIVETFEDATARDYFIPLAISTMHARTAGSLIGHHGDPFDRMLAAQSQIEQMPLVTADPAFKAFGIRTIW
jgi:PIN domain nuclease of toxin-antitoxin system